MNEDEVDVTFFDQFDCLPTLAVIVDLKPTSAFTIIEFGKAMEYISARNTKKIGF